MSPAATLLEALEPLRAHAERSAVLLDVDGTLAPIVRHEADAHVSEATRGLVIEISKRYGVVACVSGRRAATARQLVSIGSIAYIGNHGAELLRAGSASAELDPEAAEWKPRVWAFVDSAWTERLRRLRVRTEDKDAIAAFHWRGTPDEPAAELAVRELAGQAEEAGLATHWGRKVLEVRPPVALDKGRGVHALLRDADVDAAIYVGDDTTDLDAFRALRELVATGHLRYALCVGVCSEETPTELERTADLLVEGTPGVRGVLEALTS
ncbi:MAG TPA: trehalose-phosphatase [Solirubrobacteraceae bacterium]|nr:trehalose-phosphatase [Solirubrobacteraceae bacterium]